jgi:hypothetical protein
VNLKQIEAFLCLDEAEQKEMIKKRGLVDFGIAYDKYRLETGQSTSNLATLTGDIEALRQAKEAQERPDKTVTTPQEDDLE